MHREKDETSFVLASLNSANSRTKVSLSALFSKTTTPPSPPGNSPCKAKRNSRTSPSLSAQLLIRARCVSVTSTRCFIRPSNFCSCWFAARKAEAPTTWGSKAYSVSCTPNLLHSRDIFACSSLTSSACRLRMARNRSSSVLIVASCSEMLTLSGFGTCSPTSWASFVSFSQAFASFSLFFWSQSRSPCTMGASFARTTSARADASSAEISDVRQSLESSVRIVSVSVDTALRA